MRAAIAVALAIVGCAHPEPLRVRTAAAPEIRQLDVGSGTNAFVVMGARPILVDTGWGASPQKLEKALARIQVAPRDLALIVLTHGHGDHAGGVARLRQLTAAKVLAHEGDVPMLAAGHNRPLHATGFLGRLVRAFSDKPFPPFAPDLVMQAEFDRAPYGVDGKVIALPGHTPGSVAVILPSGDAIVGDLLRGGIVRTHTPERHFFHDDCRAAEAHLDQLIDMNIKRFFVGHGGPIDAKAARDKLRADPCPP